MDDLKYDLISEEVGTHLGHTVSITNSIKKPWSIIYFLTVASTGEKFVAKVKKHPGQKDLTESWTQENTLRRGQREYNSLLRTHEYFTALNDSQFRAVRPIGYLPHRNILITEYLEGTPLYEGYLQPHHLLRKSQRKLARKYIRLTGLWLRALHQMPLDSYDTEQVDTPTDTLKIITEHFDLIDQLRPQRPYQWPHRAETLEILAKVEANKQVWIHNDFHTQNSYILPTGQLAGFDVGIYRIDHPYYDVGKFIADIKTRKLRVLSAGLMPPRSVVDGFTEALLDGYTDGASEKVDRAALALYEGRFLLEKWVSTAQTISKGRLPGPISKVLAGAIVNPTFARLIRAWLKGVREL